ncbi:MAG TPA: hypothetical protein VGM73_03810 [Candidatus Didemnitutus sp.]|jgi:hypothetical protein
MKNTPHRFYKFNVPTHAPHFDNASLRWTTFVGEFLVHIVRDRSVEAFMFLNHEMAEYELRLAATDYKPLEVRLARLANKLGITIQENPIDNQTIGQNTFGQDRFLAQNRLADPEAVACRSVLVFRAMHAACELFLHNLVPHGNYWRIESNGEQQQNPHGNMFESIIHLYANMSGAEFDVYVVPPPPAGSQVFTPWMVTAKNFATVNFNQPPLVAPAHNAGGAAVCRL